MLRLHESDFVAMGELQKHADFHIRMIIAAIVTAYLVNIVWSYLFSFFLVSKMYHTANSDKVKPYDGKNKSGLMGCFLTH
jgi:hypothetical protein